MLHFKYYPWGLNPLDNIYENVFLLLMNYINTDKVYESATKASIATKHNIGDISTCCSGRCEMIGGDRFSHVSVQ